MNKFIKNDRVGILVSPGFGAGFSTWNSEIDDIVFEPIVIEMVLDKENYKMIEEYLKSEYPEGYWGGVEGLSVVWLKPGTEFAIEEYDGSESIKLKENNYWEVA